MQEIILYLTVLLSLLNYKLVRHLFIHVSAGGFEVGQMEANLSSEVAMIVMDVVALYTQSFKVKTNNHIH